LSVCKHQTTRPYSSTTDVTIFTVIASARSTCARPVVFWSSITTWRVAQDEIDLLCSFQCCHAFSRRSMSVPYTVPKKGPSTSASACALPIMYTARYQYTSPTPRPIIVVNCHPSNADPRQKELLRAQVLSHTARISHLANRKLKPGISTHGQSGSDSLLRPEEIPKPEEEDRLRDGKESVVLQSRMVKDKLYARSKRRVLPRKASKSPHVEGYLPKRSLIVTLLFK